MPLAAGLYGLQPQAYFFLFLEQNCSFKIGSKSVKVLPIWQNKRGFSKIEFEIEFQIFIAINQDQGLKRTLL
jgi:hypothetical protein